MMELSGHPRVVIVGAGFGGLWAARGLAHSGVAVTLIDRNNYHTFLPLLYQVAASELSPADIAFPIRSILRQLTNVRFMLVEVESIDLEARIVRTTEGDVPYDFLVLATGSTSHFFWNSRCGGTCLCLENARRCNQPAQSLALPL